MLSDEEKQVIDHLKIVAEERTIIPLDDEIRIVLNLIEKQSKEIEELQELSISVRAVNQIDKLQKEIEELKASHITTNNKATNTEKAKIFDVIENSIDTYIEKSKPYWEQIMTKDEMTIEEALTIIDDMYQDRYKIMSQKTEKETIVDLSKMDYIKFTNLEWASVRVLREVQSLNHKLEKVEDKIKAKIQECREILYSFEKELELKANKEKYINKESMNCLLSQISILQSLLEKE